MKRGIIKKIIKRILLVILIVALVPLTGMNNVTADQAEIDAAEKRLNELKEKQQQLENQLSNLNGQATDTQALIAQYDALSSELALSIYNLSLQIADKENEISAKQADIEAMIANINMISETIIATMSDLEDARMSEAEQYEAMKLRIQYMYENGETTFLDMLFSSQDMVDFLNKADYIAEISEYDRDKLEEYALIKDSINQMLTTLSEQQSELSIQESVLEVEKQELEMDMADLLTIKNAQEVEKGSYDMVIAAKNSELDSLYSQMSDTSKNIELAKQEVADQEAIWERAKAEWAAYLAMLAAQNKDADAALAAKLAEINITGFTWPLPGYNTITSEYGMRRHPILGIDKLHDGMDISGPDVNGKPIVAAYSGTVILSEYYWGYGECIKIDHGGGVQTLYAHCSARLVSVGQVVNAGDTIALVGSTGNSTGPHLHLSIIIKGEFLNPRDYFKIP